MHVIDIFKGIKIIYAIASLTALFYSGFCTTLYLFFFHRFLLDCTRVPVQHQNTQGETCVHISALNHRLQCLKILLDGPFKKVQSLVYQKDNLGCTVLHCAVLVNDNDIALWLLQRFGKNIANVANGENILPLHLAAAQGTKRCKNLFR